MPLLTAKDWSRFWSHVKRSRKCWEWIDGLTKAGYGNFSVGGRKGRRLYAHRVSYEKVYGKIPKGKVIDHTCRNRKCVNPSHLEAVTLGENLRRGQTVTANNLGKTVCSRGHRLPPYRRGHKRQCGQCANLLRRISRSKKK